VDEGIIKARRSELRNGLTCRAADFIPDAEAGLRPNIREILFLDTPDFRLLIC
jgi:hypothetical protein